MFNYNRQSRQKVKEQRKKTRVLLQLLFVVVVSMFITGILLVTIESFIRGNFQETKIWFTENRNPFLLNYVILYTIFLVLFGISNDLLITLLMYTIIIGALTVINKFKFLFLGEYLYPWDILLYQQLFNLLPQLIGDVDMKIAGLVVIGLVISIVFIIFLKKRIVFLNFKLTVISRVGLLIVSLSLLVSIFVFRQTPLNQLFTNMQIENRNWNQAVNYRINGFLLSFVLNTESTLVFAPEGYSQENISEILANIKASTPKKQAHAVQMLLEKPNIIFIMNEAFWDPTLLSSVKFSGDPMPAVRQNQSGLLLSPQFGGGTANIEFEALTGLNVSFLPAGSIAYQQFIGQPVPSLASVLSNQGYESIGIHPYYDWFWSRNKVYDLIGFSEFISLDQFKDAQYRGPYIGDNEVNKKILEKTEQIEKPVFIYAVTMQNHGPYEKNRYSQHEISIESKELSENSLYSLETYTQGVVEADQAFGELIQYYKNSAEPTIIIFFGDHLPFLGSDYLAYKEAGYINNEAGENWSLGEYHRMRTTPLVIWSNYLESGQKLEMPSTISPSFLAPYIFDLAGLEQPLFYQFLQQFSKVLPGLSVPVKTDPQGTLYKETPQEFKEMEDMYLRLQYDILLGKQHSVEELFRY